MGSTDGTFCPTTVGALARAVVAVKPFHHSPWERNTGISPPQPWRRRERERESLGLNAPCALLKKSLHCTGRMVPHRSVVHRSENHRGFDSFEAAQPATSGAAQPTVSRCDAAKTDTSSLV